MCFAAGELVSELMKTVRKMGLMKRHYLMVFLLPQLQEVDLSLYETNDMILHTLADRCKVTHFDIPEILASSYVCLSGTSQPSRHMSQVQISLVVIIYFQLQNLKKLYLCWNAAVGASLLNDVIKEMPKLTHINVAGTKCDDEVLCTISKNCPLLQDLDVSDCNVTKKGVHQLCAGHSPTMHRLPHVIRLNLTGTKVDAEGIKLVLKKMKQIKYLEHEWLWNILYDLYTPCEPNIQVEDEEKLALMKINFFGCPYTPMVLKAIDVLCAYCPNLCDVSIFGCGFDDQAMFKLARLPNLSKLCLEGSHNMVTFRWGLLPFLHQRGETLRELSLTCINDLNMVEVSTYCVNLQVLSLIDVSTSTVHNIQARPYLRSLQQLEIRQHQKDTFGEDAFRFIMTHCHNIKQLYLYCVNFLTDTVLEAILKENPLQFLEKLTFERSCGYTSDMMFRLLAHCPSLSPSACYVFDNTVRDVLEGHVNNYNHYAMIG